MEVREDMVDRLRVIEFGVGSRSGGPKVVVLHGGPGMYGYMETFCREFLGGRHTVYFEQRGSEQLDCDIGVGDHLNDLRNIVDRCSDGSKPTLVGHSWGAMLAVLFAGRYSGAVGKLVLVGCGPLSDAQGDEFQREIGLRMGSRKDEYDRLWEAVVEEKDEAEQQRLADAYIDEMMAIYQGGADSGAEVQPRSWDFRGAYRTMCESDRLVAENGYVTALGNIDVPVTVIHGGRDVICPQSHFELVRRHVSDVRTYELAGAGHYPWAGECRAEFEELLKCELGSSR